MTVPFPIHVLVAHRGGARLFESVGPKSDWRLVADIDHPEGTKKTSELVTDQPGQMMESSREGQNAADPRVEPTQHVAEIFAKALAERLKRERTDNRMRQLVLVAPPAFLGLLRAALDKATADLVAADLDRNLTDAKPDAIRAALADRVRV